jgi:uncharacterized protein (TIRG00374 family)
MFLLSIGLIGWFVYSRAADLALLPVYVKQITLQSIGLLALLELLFLLAAAQSNRSVYRSLGVSSSLYQQLNLLLAASTVERLLPSGGAAGMSSFVWLARNRGISVADSVKMSATTFVLGYAQIIPLLFVPLLYAGQSALPPAKFTVLAGVSAGFVILILGLASGIGSKRLMEKLQKTAFPRRFPRMMAGIGQAHEHVRWSWRHRLRLLVPLLLLWLLYPVRIAMLWVCFAAFQTPMPLSLLWAGYSITILISFLTFLPTTLGVFELSMVGTFALLGAPTELATAVTLLYRAFTYWLPIPFGLLAWWNLRRKVTE